MHNCFMECKLSRESNVVGDKRGRGEKKICENGEKYHMESHYDVVSCVLLSVSGLLTSGIDHSISVGQADRI